MADCQDDSLLTGHVQWEVTRTDDTDKAGELVDVPSDDADEKEAKANERPLRAALSIMRIGWPVTISNICQCSQSFFTIWLIGDAGELFMAAFGLANVLCNVTGHSFLWGIGAVSDEPKKKKKAL